VHADLRLSGGEKDHTLSLAGIALVADPGGRDFIGRTKNCSSSPIFIFEKGSSFATRGVLLPPTIRRRPWARLARFV